MPVTETLPPSTGSSPLARGLLIAYEKARRWVRIIPARAGFTVHPGGGGPGEWDHPRSRGVYLPARQDEGVDEGSSPLARGLLFYPRERGGLQGIIPARAGFTCPA